MRLQLCLPVCLCFVQRNKNRPASMISTWMKGVFISDACTSCPASWHQLLDRTKRGKWTEGGAQEIVGGYDDIGKCRFFLNSNLSWTFLQPLSNNTTTQQHSIFFITNTPRCPRSIRGVVILSHSVSTTSRDGLPVCLYMLLTRTFFPSMLYQVLYPSN